MPSKEYLETILEKIKEVLTPAEWQALNRAAIPKSGGRASWSSASGRFKLGELKGEFLQSASDEELEQVWARLEKWHGRTADREPFERAASHVLQELLRRGREVAQCPLEDGARKMSSLAKRLEGLPEEISIARGAVSLSKSAAHLAMLGVVPPVSPEVPLAALGVDLPIGEGDEPVSVYDLVLVRSVLGQEGEPVSKSAGDWLVEMGIASTEPTGVDAEPADVGAEPADVGAEPADVDAMNLCAAISVAKSDDEKQIIYYVVSEPDSLDAHGERISAETIEDALHKYMSGGRALKLEHDKRIDGRAEVVEGFLAPCDLEKFHGQTPGSGTVKAGSSIVAIHYTDKALWDELKKSDHGISWGGEAKRVRKGTGTDTGERR